MNELELNLRTTSLQADLLDKITKDKVAGEDQKNEHKGREFKTFQVKHKAVK